jgi:anthranilate phosphoribosyltransferase
LFVAGVAPSLRDGVALAAETIDDGRAAAVLARLREPGPA